MSTLRAVLALYLLVGAALARIVCPLSFPFGRNAAMVMLIWPLFIAAQVFHMVTGRYPRWTPFI